MTDQAQKPQSERPMLQRMLDKRHAVYAFIGKTYNETILYTKNNPERALKIGCAALVLSSYLAYKTGDRSYDNKFVNLSRIVASIDTRMISMEKKIDTIATDQTNIVNGINDMSRGVNQRIVTLENEKNTKKAVEAGEKHVVEMKKKNSFWHKITLGIF